MVPRSMHHKIVSIKSSGLKSEKQLSLEIADGPIWLGQIVLRIESKNETNYPCWFFFGYLLHWYDPNLSQLKCRGHVWKERPFSHLIWKLNIYLFICACIHLFLSAAHLDLKKPDIKLVPPLTLEILDGPVWLGQLVLRNELTVRSTILVDPFFGFLLH